MKQFKVNGLYEVFNEVDYGTWANILICTKRTKSFVYFDELENGHTVGSYKRKIKHTTLTEYVYLTSDSIVWAN